MDNQPNQKIYKNFGVVETKASEDSPRTLIVQISDSLPDRSNDTVQPDGVITDNFMKNPVVLFAHNYTDLPIAKCIALKSTDTGILATVEFPEEGLYDKADTIFQMYKQGFLNAWSIGFMPKDYEPNDNGGYNFKSWELFEFSSVPVPDNPRALTVMRSKGINVDVVLEKGVLPFHETPKAPEDESWDAGEEVKKADVSDLKAMCAWVDSENAEDKTAYKLPHHKADGDHAVVWKGVAAAMEALLGARGGVDIPEGDRKGVYNHLAKHYKQFEKEVPEFKEISEVVVKIGDTEEVIKTLDDARETIDALTQENKTLKEQLEEKAGRKLSAKHEKLLKDAHDHMNQAMDMMKTVLDSVAQSEDDNDGDEGKQTELPLTKKLLNQINHAQTQMRETDKQVGLTLRLFKQIKEESKLKGGENNG